jgi:hypothetical protein
VTLANDSYAAVAMDSDGDFVVAWVSAISGSGASGWLILARRFSLFAPLDLDASAAIEPLTDGVLALRHLFEFTGPALTVGAVDAAACRRCDAEGIGQHLAALDLALDVDGNSEALPLTDGLLILRYLFGFRGSPLTVDAVGVDCVRCEAAEIEEYLEGLGG